MSDAFASIAVVVGGALILLYDMRWVDPAITIGIASYILYLGLTEIGGTIRTLMLGSPEDIGTDSVIGAVSDLEGVIDFTPYIFGRWVSMMPRSTPVWLSK